MISFSSGVTFDFGGFERNENFVHCNYLLRSYQKEDVLIVHVLRKIKGIMSVFFVNDVILIV